MKNRVSRPRGPSVEFAPAARVTLGVDWLFGCVLPGSVGVVCRRFSSGDTDCGFSPALFVPGIGPFIAMPFATDQRSGPVMGEYVAAFLADGLVQNAGAVMLPVMPRQ